LFFLTVDDFFAFYDRSFEQGSVDEAFVITYKLFVILILSFIIRQNSVYSYAERQITWIYQ